MKELRDFLKGPYKTAEMDLTDPGWAAKAQVPSKAGWYFIGTTAPLEILARQALWLTEYQPKRSSRSVPVKNYNLAARCRRRTDELARFFNLKYVYSGLATNLQGRAREHTLPDPGTAALALGRYPELHAYSWRFSYLALDSFMPNCADTRVVLRIGEQIWRAENGWPVLCSG